jgi:MtN3 and saliva related transmembrane protein
MTVSTNEYDPVGYAAATSLCMILVPQLMHILKVKKMDQISWYFLILNLITSILFLTYGILLEALPMIIANIILCIQNIVLIFLKIKYNVIDMNNALRNI